MSDTDDPLIRGCRCRNFALRPVPYSTFFTISSVQLRRFIFMEAALGVVILGDLLIKDSWCINGVNSVLIFDRFRHWEHTYKDRARDEFLCLVSGGKAMISCTSLPPNSGGRAQHLATGYQSKENLIRQLVSALDKPGPFLKACEDCAAEEIILDTNVDGVRYLLIRMPVLIPAHVSLSPQEQEIVRMVAKGYPTKAIARVLNISCWTVSAHLRRVFTKLGSHRGWLWSPGCRKRDGSGTCRSE